MKRVLGTSLLLFLLADFGRAESTDESYLREQGLKTDTESLIAFLRGRSLTEEEIEVVRQEIEQLGARSYRQREAASAKLIARGECVLRFLREKLNDPDREVAHRASECVRKIRSSLRIRSVLSAVRLLGERGELKAIPTLLLYLPFTPDPTVQEECFNALHAIARMASPHVPEAILKATREVTPHRRAAAGFVLARLSTREPSPILLRLQEDEEPLVRFHVARGLLLAERERGVGMMIALLKTAPEEIEWKAEAWLFRVAKENSPIIPSKESPAEWKQARQELWEQWWMANRGKVSLAKLDSAEVYLHHTLIPEMHADRISEVDRNGRVLWEMKGIPEPRYAELLPGGRVLISEARTNRVTERDRSGKILWEHPHKDTAYCHRLPNGNTILGGGHNIVEVTREGKQVFEYRPEKGFYMHGINRQPNGNYVMVSMNGKLREIDRAGKEIFTVELPKKGGENWCGVQGLPGQRYLVVECGKGTVLEVDRSAKVHWRHELNDSCCAQRLANGHTVILSFNQKLLIELDRNKKKVWEHRTGSQPWRFLRR